MTLGDKLQSLRKSKGLSQTELANELNVTRQAISKWETGSIPDVDNLVKISKFFGCSLDYLLLDIEQEIPKHDSVHKRVSLSKLLPYFGILFSLAILLILYIMSRFVETPTTYYSHTEHTYIYSTKLSRSFYGLIDQYNLHPILYICIAVWFLSISVIFLRNKLPLKQFRFRKYHIPEALAYTLTMIGTAIWYYYSMHPGRMRFSLWDLLLYLVIQFTCITTSHFMITKKRKGEAL